jgi:hypothetical protein
MLENTEEAIKNGQSRETDNIYIVHKAKTSDTKQSRKHGVWYDIKVNDICRLNKQHQITLAKGQRLNLYLLKLSGLGKHHPG